MPAPDDAQDTHVRDVFERGATHLAAKRRRSRRPTPQDAAICEVDSGLRGHDAEIFAWAGAKWEGAHTESQSPKCSYSASPRPQQVSAPCAASASTESASADAQACQRCPRAAGKTYSAY